ncbi:MAG: YbaY family lipoprotein [Cyanobacteriota bacterium]
MSGRPRVRRARAFRHGMAVVGLACFAVAGLESPARAGTITGTAILAETSTGDQPVQLPADAVFEAVLIDAALADAPALELGRMRRHPPGPSPIPFRIPYRDGDITPRGRYAVRATVRQGERLLYTTDTFHPVLTPGARPPLVLRLVAVPPGRPGPLGRLPATWRGESAGASGTTRWQIDLAPDGTFQLRQTFLRRPQPERFDDIGRWRLAGQPQRLVLRGGREAPVVLEPLQGGEELRLLDPAGQPIASAHPDRLKRVVGARPIEPRLHLQGLFRYMADAANIELCATGHQLPVAMEGEYLALERAYRTVKPGRAGKPLLVNLEGMITGRPSPEPALGTVRTLVVERFIGVHPGGGCPNGAAVTSPEG